MRSFTSIRSVFASRLSMSACYSASSRNFSSSLSADKLQVVKKIGKPTPLPALQDLVFGQSFSDHMLEIDWDIDNGWHTPIIKPLSPLNLHPAVSSLHYSLQCFEGMKAFIDPNGDIRTFRFDRNMARFKNSVRRLALPDFDETELLKLIDRLLDLDHSFIPNKDGYSIYLRPTMIATQPTLGVSAPKHAKLFVITCPVGPYYPSGFKPVKLWADTKSVRAWPGGSGDSKLGSNYAPTIFPQQKAAQEGWSQILWLYPTLNGVKHDYAMTEVGTMNFFMRWRNEQGVEQLVTPPLDTGIILPGVTRDSILNLARSIEKTSGVEVVERDILMRRDFLPAIEEGRVLEAFGAGTAAVVSPIDAIGFEDKVLSIPLDPKNPSAGIGPYAMTMLNNLWDIQYGRSQFKDWSKVVPKVLRK